MYSVGNSSGDKFRPGAADDAGAAPTTTAAAAGAKDGLGLLTTVNGWMKAVAKCCSLLYNSTK